MVFSIIKKEILQNFRDKKAAFWMILFPIIMIFILGISLSQFFGKSTLSVPKTTVVYTVENDTEQAKRIENFFNDSKKELNMEFSKGRDKNKILQEIKTGEYDCYIDIKDSKDIVVYSNDIKDFNSALVINLLNIYAEKTNAIESIIKENSQGIKFIDKNSKPNFVNIKSLDKAKTPTAFDYYSVTMLTMIILYATLTGAMTILGERIRNTMPRIACSSVNKFILFAGKLIGAFVVVTVQIGILFLVTKYIFKADWGNNLTPIFGILLTLIFMAISLGMGLSRLFRNPNLISVFSNITIVLLNFLGGAYIPLETFGQNNIIMLISNISPLKWSNQAIFKVIYGNDFSLVTIAIIVNLAVGLFFLIVPSLFLKKGEV